MKYSILPYNTGTLITDIDINEVNLDKTFSSTQITRWVKNEQGYWSSTFGSRLIILKQDEKTGDIRTNILSSDIHILVRYLDLSTDYGSAVNSLVLLPDDHEIVEQNRGCRIIHQDFLEALITQVISQVRPLRKDALREINTLCTCYGNAISEVFDDIAFKAYTFLTLDQFLSLNYDTLMYDLNFGCTALYLLNVVDWLKRYKDDFMGLSAKPYDELCSALFEIKNINIATVDKVMLYGSHTYDVFPFDHLVMLTRATEFSHRRYPEGSMGIGKYRGIFYQYLSNFAVSSGMALD